ncbi:ribonuclease E/G [Desertifilum sp. FACHB-1129]|uniref:Ribonuclease E n=1 Tax=Desertifilum tharense IPPAS B-1220 TaxID=1781255 RepID=A0A1E5QCJ6_9CYAN|nr:MULTISPECIES: Rne/Rng family ribonuclease [Desertifilum]MDA0210858.1 Rne/Rng family ribonuclease [Cyanobacteria bacterium FC1]MBD2312091.1 ribonuclease E/G [Desertifilum sp. FACHB-1129]MBD2322248.1 ribonuclease E/G [Desertifilum sp. FACHB-866]MBD2332285.1 ribonuclease E/G [Desertifilum sp. FACHB-868]OEJ72357.1 ribonuclease E [Desertifilum tharense IPPAS B-1220]
MPKQIIIAEQHRIAAVFSEDQIQELVVATGSHQVGDIYLGVVENVLPGIDAAFVNIGDAERNGFIHVTDLGPLRLRRSAGAITELLTPQQKVLVQVMKEPTGSKGPRLTGNITLPGRYLVLMPYGRGVNLSRRIRSENERNRLRALAILVKPPGMGLLVRTEAEGMAEEAIMEDLETLQKQWEAIQQEASSTRAPALLNRDDDFIQRVLREMYNADVNRIVVDSHTGLKRVKQQLLNWSSGKTPQGVLIDHHRDRIPVLEYFRVNAAIREALKPRVDLPSGGYIIIEPTEALTVIDVNSGSFTRSATARETVLWTNCEAATEIARQLRLRNIAGVIIVDFIDMDSRRDQLQVLEHFNKALRADKARPQIAQLSELGLVELTRKRQGQNIYELFGRPCPTCNGLGHLVHLPGEGETVPQPLVERSATVLKDVPTRPAPESPYETRRVDARYAPPAPSEPQPSWQNDDLESEYDTFRDSSELDLINHPNYQERSGLNNNRRRRRRRIGGEGDLGRSPNEAPSVGVNFKATPEPLALDTPELAEDLSGNGREEWDEKSDRFLGSRRVTAKRQSPKTVSPPEVISVEMTPEEQDVYALMGISPLILLNREVKNPKSAIIAVTLPGEKPQAPAVSVPETSVADVTEDEAPVQLPQENISFTGAGDPVSPLVSASSEEEASESSTDADAEASASDTRRRRRRRSSAPE